MPFYIYSSPIFCLIDNKSLHESRFCNGCFNKYQG